MIGIGESVAAAAVLAAVVGYDDEDDGWKKKGVEVQKWG